MSLLGSCRSRFSCLFARPPLSSPRPICSSTATLCDRSFSTTATLAAKKNKGPKIDKRIRLIRYFLDHPRLPRPLKFGRQRHLRHWTIHRAWQLYQSQLRQKRELELERQYNSMRQACEALRLMDKNGMTVDQPQSKDVGRLYRIAMMKLDVWNGVPIEYARIQTDSPPKDGWNHEWQR